MASKNRFDINGEDVTIYIKKNNETILGFTTYREDYIEELSSATWSINNGYIYNKNLGYLHRYIMKQWYGEQVLKDMKDNDYIVDHLSDEGVDCRVSNLAFLPSDENKAKGFTVDKQRKVLCSKMALNIFKDFTTQFFQITIFFNDPMYYVNEAQQQCYEVSKVKLLYDCDYRIVINDAREILLEYNVNKKIEPAKLHYVDIKIEKAIKVKLSEEEKGAVMIERDGKTYLVLSENTKVLRSNYNQGWLPKERRDFHS